MKYTAKSVDAPLIDPDDDCLDRATFAKRLFNIIEGTSKWSNIRIGINGSWGTGKTTTMNFLRYYCTKADHPVALYHPWRFKNRDHAWQGFVACIDKALVNLKDSKIGRFGRERILKSLARGAREVIKFANTRVGVILGALVLAPLEGLLEPTKKKVQDELNKILGDKRLFIFIDDLGRAEPDVMYDVLMMLNEIVDLQRCVYIVGLDKEVASEVIRQKMAIESSKDFLEKIIHWSFDLPEPQDSDWEYFLQREIKYLNKNIKYEILNSILEYLPKNPRKFKHFLRYLSGLHESFLSRFDDEELNWRALYLAQLLRFEHPKFFEIMACREDLLRDLSTGLLADTFSETQENKDAVPKWKNDLSKILDELEDYRDASLKRGGVLKLYGAMRETYLTVEQLRNHLLVLEVPELLTWKEYNRLIKTLLDRDEKYISKKLRKYISDSKKTKEIERVKEFARMLLRDRDDKLSKIADMSDVQEMKEQLKYIKEIMRICAALLDIDQLFAEHNPIFNSEIYMEWYRQLEKWAHFKKQVIYSEIRDLEKALAIKMTTKVTVQASTILDVLLSAYGRGLTENMIAFKAVEDQIISMLQESLSEQLFDRFRGSRGFGDLHDDSKHIGEKQLLFTPHNIFHNKKNYAILKSISEKAPENPLIRNNFLDYITMLFLAALRGFAWVDRNEALKLFQNKEFMGIIWTAAISRPLNMRMVGTLESYRLAIRQKLSDDSILPIPKWWEDLLVLMQKKDGEK